MKIFSRHLERSIRSITRILNELAELYNFDYIIEANYSKISMKVFVNLTDKQYINFIHNDIKFNLQYFYSYSCIDYKKNKISYSCEYLF
jgi:hypothetical protein